MIGTNKGCIYAIHPDTLIPYSNGIHRYDTNNITKMTISIDSQFLVYTDNISCKTTLLYFNGKLWKLIGKGQCHNKAISDFITFGQAQSRLISVGKDMVNICAQVTDFARLFLTQKKI